MYEDNIVIRLWGKAGDGESVLRVRERVVIEQVDNAIMFWNSSKCQMSTQPSDVTIAWLQFEHLVGLKASRKSSFLKV